MKKVTAVLSSLLVATSAGFVPAADARSVEIHLEPVGHGVSAYDDLGRMLWHRDLDLLLPLQIEDVPRGYRINRTVTLDRFGRIEDEEKPTASTNNGVAAATTTYTWDIPSPIFTIETPAYVPQAFDNKGNAWTVVAGDTAKKSQVLKYVAKSGVWKPIKELPAVFEYGRLDVDALGNVTIVALSGTPDDGFKLNAVRYEPDVGWSKPVVIFATPYVANAMVNYGVVGDKKGNAVVAAGLDPTGGITVVYSMNARAWQPSAPIPLPVSYIGGNVNNIALSRSPSGKHIALAYIGLVDVPDDTEGHFGFFSNTFDASTLTFLPAESVPKTTDYGDAGIPVADAYEDRVNMVVDNSGNESIVWPSGTSLKPRKLLGTYASQRTSGSWSDPVRLTGTIYPMDNVLSSSAVDADGRVAACATASVVGSTTLSHFVVFKYLPGQGWSMDDVATWTGTLFSRSRIAWFGTGQAVGTYLGAMTANNGPQTLSYSVFDGNSWGTSAYVPPGDISTFEQSISTDPSGTPLLLFNPVTDDFNGVIQATRLRSSP